MNLQELEKTARALVAPGKGILAADESFGTIGKRFEAVGIESSEDSRRAYREILFTTPNIGEYLSGVILFDETIRQKASDGRPLAKVLEDQGIVPGIKVDKSTVPMPLSPNEKFTQGLDGLHERLSEYRELGARFTKWRAVITIGNGIPTKSCVEANAEALALYAAFAQDHDLVPIVEPEVLIDGDHSIEQSYEATLWTLHETFDETIRQKTSDGTPIPQALENAGVIPGIKVDKSTVDLPLSEGEKFTQGLDGLGDRLAEYTELGARFTKWRAVITIGDGIPTESCIAANAEALALYAAFAQDHDLVPIVEPEVLIDGDHSIEQCYDATEWMLNRTFEEIYEHGVELSGLLLKPNMVISGKDAPQQSSVEEVARDTVECLLRTVPPAVPGIVFLSGGQTDLQATAHLNAMNSLDVGLPWELSFSYARALQGQPMQIWGGDESKVQAAQKAFHHRAKMNSAARSGDYSEEMEEQAA